jgi:hypothetical protein
MMIDYFCVSFVFEDGEVISSHGSCAETFSTVDEHPSVSLSDGQENYLLMRIEK